MRTLISRVILSVFASGVLSAQAFADNLAKPMDLGMQEAATPNMERLHEFHDGLLMYVITTITLLVTVLLLWIIIRYNKKSNPEPSKTTHNVLLEVLWTVVPIVILIVIAVPSFKLLYYLDRTPEIDMTLKVTGYQWGWTYEYPDQGGIEYNGDMIAEDELDEYIKDGQGRRLLETYDPVVLPIDKNIQVITTSTDVIHSWAMPAFGVKKDSVPGRLNETWMRIEKPGLYYGQCSEICGINHSFMPISVYAVQGDDFDQWVSCYKKNANNDNIDYPARHCAQTLNFDKKYRVTGETK